MEPIQDITPVVGDWYGFLDIYDLTDPHDVVPSDDISENVWLATSELFIARMYYPN